MSVAAPTMCAVALIFDIMPPRLYPVPADNLTQHLSVLSVIIGLTAWHGVNKVLNPASGDVLVVSAGAGAVGSLVGQLAKIKGAKVIGIAGSEAKCKFMKDEVCVLVNYCISRSWLPHIFFSASLIQFAVWLRLCHQLQNR